MLSPCKIEKAEKLQLICISEESSGTEKKYFLINYILCLSFFHVVRHVDRTSSRFIKTCEILLHLQHRYFDEYRLVLNETALM